METSELKYKGKTSLESAQNLKELEEVFRVYVGKKGEVTRLLQILPQLDQKERVQRGKEINALKDFLVEIFERRKNEFQESESKNAGDKRIDITAPGKRIAQGHLHPLTHIQRSAIEIFSSMGFEVAEGPEIETEWYNFDALNIPADHPARDMWDTFWLKDSHLLLRTHTSPVQIRYMKSHTPPLRIIAPGRIFRYEATDARHEINFYQLEGLMVGKDISVSHFKGIIQEFFRSFFEKHVVVRLRPSYFPFTEPSFEVDMSCLLCEGKGCASCGQGGWIEIMGAGMVHPNVFKSVGYIHPPAGGWQGFAFGIGLDRLAMMKYKINDIRLLYGGDLRFLQQF